MRLYAVGAFIFINLSLVSGMQRNDLAFRNETATISPSFDKTFTTTVSLNINGTQFNESALRAVVETYYNSSIPGGTVVDLTNGSSTNNVTYRASYTILYNFSSLESFTNAEVVNVVSNETLVQTSFENDTNFAKNFEWVGNFIATGNSACSGAASCKTYASCTADVTGNDVYCQSQCFADPNICFNNAFCIQSNGNTPPSCSCVTSSDNWYVGSNCKTMLNLWMPIVYFVVIFLLLLMVIFITCFCVHGIDKRLEKEKRKEFIRASKERGEPMSKNQKVFVTIKSALGLKTAKENFESKEMEKVEPKEVEPPAPKVDPPTPEVANHPVPAPRTLGTPVATSLDSTHDPASSSTSSEFQYAAIRLPGDAEQTGSRRSSFSSREDIEDARIGTLLEESLANTPGPGAVGEAAGGRGGGGFGAPPPAPEPPTYAVVNKRQRPTGPMESTV